MNWDALALMAMALAAIPAALTLINLRFYRITPRVEVASRPGESISVLIPARNEEVNIAATLEAVLANRGVEFEVIVLDDHSTDRTAEMVAKFAARDARVRLEAAPPLPADWCGKPHACHVLAKLARFKTLVFIDADVRLASDALMRVVNFLHSSRSALASGVPHQELETFSERLLLPQIQFVLLGYLPLPLMRWTRRPSFSAGCGQLFVIRRDAYEAVGGHKPVRTTLHDGLKLPRLFRCHGFKTELFDATDVASCRMYRSDAEVWRGLGKNATEGLAASGAIVPMSLLLFGGQVLPFLLLAAWPQMTFVGGMFVASAIGLAWLPRFIGVRRFRQPLGSVWLHPVSVLALLAIQWLAFGRKVVGKPSVWKGRSYTTTLTRA